jgi:hypothetical protein
MEALFKMEKEKLYKLQTIDNSSMLPGDLKRSPDDSYHALSPRYLRKNMPGFLFTIFGGVL